MVVSGHSYYPVYEKSRDHVVGVVSLKAIYANLAAGIPVKVRDLLVPPKVLITPLNSGSPLLKPGARSSMNRSTGTGIT